jgi:hypothetical protein
MVATARPKAFGRGWSLPEGATSQPEGCNRVPKHTSQSPWMPANGKPFVGEVRTRSDAAIVPQQAAGQ